MTPSQTWSLEKTAVLALCRPNEVADAEVADPVILSDAERSRASRFAFPHLRKRFVCGRLMLRNMIGELLAVEPRRIALAKSRSGNPTIVGSRLQVSISYSRGLVAAAVFTEQPLGLDVESSQGRFDPDRISALALRAEERNWLVNLTVEDKRRHFLWIWVQKEAVTKAMGLGLRYPLNELNADVIAERLRCKLELLTIGDEFAACLVVPESAKEVQTAMWLGPHNCVKLGSHKIIGDNRPWQVPLP